MIQETRQYIMDNLTITSMSNEELEDKIEELIFEKTKDGFFSMRGKLRDERGNRGVEAGSGTADACGRMPVFRQKDFKEKTLKLLADF